MRGEARANTGREPDHTYTALLRWRRRRAYLCQTDELVQRVLENLTARAGGDASSFAPSAVVGFRAVNRPGAHAVVNRPMNSKQQGEQAQGAEQGEQAQGAEQGEQQ